MSEPVWQRIPPEGQREGLNELAAEVARDLTRLNYPPANWALPAQTPDGTQALDVLIVGAGMLGQTAAFALQREGIGSFRIVDKARRGEEGPWATYARMEILRSPKQLTGCDLGIPSLTFRAWYEAQHGAAGWETLYKIHRLEWRDYLLWVRDALALPVENETALVALEPAGALLRAVIEGPAGRETLFARKIVLATGREGAGGENMPSFPSCDPLGPARGKTLFHSSDNIDFPALRGRHVAVLGASASAFDNAARALEAGAAVTLYSRRRVMPQVNKSRWMGFSGFLRHFPTFDDATRWRFLSYTTGLNTPPPHESVLRCQSHEKFSIVFGESWRDLLPTGDTIRVLTESGERQFDAAICGTGFKVDLSERPELAAFLDDLMLWRDRVSPREAQARPHLARFPYLDQGFALVERERGCNPALRNIHLLNYAATMSHGALTADIPGIGLGATRVVQAIGRDLFLADVDQFFDSLVAFEEPELLPTPYYVPPDRR